VATNLDEEISFASLLIKVRETGLESMNPERDCWNWVLRVVGLAGNVTQSTAPKVVDVPVNSTCTYVIGFTKHVSLQRVDVACRHRVIIQRQYEIDKDIAEYNCMGADWIDTNGLSSVLNFAVYNEVRRVHSGFDSIDIA
jgi:hypothetical protein